jgi:hypothetical protein
MTAQIETSWVYEYRDNVRLALQQKSSKLRSKVRVATGLKGEGYRPELVVGQAGYQKRNTRYEQKTAQELDITGRWNEPDDYDVGPFYEDRLDRLRNGIQIDGTYTKAARKAINRAMDDVIIDAMFGSAKTGKNGGGAAATFDTTNMRVAAGSAGLTVSKLAAAKQILIKQEVLDEEDDEKPQLACTEIQWKNLLDDITYVSGDFNKDKPLKKGEVEEYVGFEFTFFSSNRLTELSGSDRRCPFWVKSAVELGIWDEINPQMRIAKELRGEPVEIYGMFTIGATRLDEQKIGEILCSET